MIDNETEVPEMSDKFSFMRLCLKGWIDLLLSRTINKSPKKKNFFIIFLNKLSRFLFAKDVKIKLLKEFMLSFIKI